MFCMYPGLWSVCPVLELSFSAGMGNPTSIDFVATDLHQMVAAYTTAKTIVYDLETAKPVVNLDSGVTYGQLERCSHLVKASSMHNLFLFADGTPNTQINKVICHPTLPIVITGHEDKYIRFFDVNTGKECNETRRGMITVCSFSSSREGHSLHDCPHGRCDRPSY